MEYSQRDSGIFIRQNLIPQSDLQAERVYQGGQIIHPGIHQHLAYNVGIGPFGPRLNTADLFARQQVSPGTPTQSNLIVPRTDTVAFTSGDFIAPPYIIGGIIFVITAISGTSPVITFFIEGKSSQGTYNEQNGGTFTAGKSATGFYYSALGQSATGENQTLAPIYRIRTTVTGTTPSITWYADILTK